jgi:hypothetical protein
MHPRYAKNIMVTKVATDYKRRRPLKHDLLPIEREMLAETFAEAMGIPSANIEDVQNRAIATFGSPVTEPNVRGFGFDDCAALDEILRITGWRGDESAPTVSGYFAPLDKKRKIIRDLAIGRIMLYDVFKAWWSGELPYPDFFPKNTFTIVVNDDTENSDITYITDPEYWRSWFGNWAISKRGRFFQLT